MSRDDPCAASPVRLGLAAARTNIVPAAIIAVVAIGVLAGYRHWPAFHDTLEVVRSWKERFGFGFSAVSTGIFGGFLPVLFRLIPRETRRDPQWRHLPFFVGFWACKGVEVDALYRFQAWLFGDSPAAEVVVAKVFVDQFLYVPFWAVPTMMGAYLWMDSRFRIARTIRRLGARWYRNRCLPLLLANWGVWTPAVAVIYNLPLSLQLPLQNLVLCLFVLLVMILTRAETPDDQARPPGQNSKASPRER